MFCKICGNELADGVRFCPNCGTPAPVPAAPHPAPQPQAQAYGGYSNAPVQQPPQKTKKKLLIAVIAVAVCICLTVGAYFLFSGGKSKNYPQTPREAVARYIDAVRNKDVEEYYLVHGIDLEASVRKQLRMALHEYYDNDYAKLREGLKEIADDVLFEYSKKKEEWDARCNRVFSLEDAVAVVMDIQRVHYRETIGDYVLSAAEMAARSVNSFNIYEMDGLDKADAMYNLKESFSRIQEPSRPEQAFVTEFELNDIEALYDCLLFGFSQERLIIQTKKGCFMGGEIRYIYSVDLFR